MSCLVCAASGMCCTPRPRNQQEQLQCSLTTYSGVAHWRTTRLATISSLKLPLQSQRNILPLHHLYPTVLLKYIIPPGINKLSWNASSRWTQHLYGTHLLHNMWKWVRKKIDYCVAVGTESHHQGSQAYTVHGRSGSVLKNEKSVLNLSSLHWSKMFTVFIWLIYKKLLNKHLKWSCYSLCDYSSNT